MECNIIIGLSVLSAKGGLVIISPIRRHKSSILTFDQSLAKVSETTAMPLDDGYYFVVTQALSGNGFITYDVSGKKATIQNPSNILQFLSSSEEMVLRVESISDDAYLIYFEKYKLALTLQRSSGPTVTLRTLKPNDERQWWRFEQGSQVLVNYKRTGPQIALEMISGTVGGGYYSPGSVQQQWLFSPISGSFGPEDGDTDDGGDIEENRDWLRDMLRYYTSNNSAAYHAIGAYPYERSHITHPNSDLRRAIKWQNS